MIVITSLVLRNYLAQRAIERADDDDYTEVRSLLDELKRPYVGSDRDTMALPKPDEASTGAEALPPTTDTSQKRAYHLCALLLRRQTRVHCVSRCHRCLSQTGDLRIESTILCCSDSRHLIFVNVNDLIDRWQNFPWQTRDYWLPMMIEMSRIFIRLSFQSECISRRCLFVASSFDYLFPLSMSVMSISIILLAKK